MVTEIIRKFFGSETNRASTETIRTRHGREVAPIASQPVYGGQSGAISRHRYDRPRDRRTETVFRRAVLRDTHRRAARLAHPRVAA